MPGDTTLVFQSILKRLHAGDATARRALLDAACGRLSRLTAHILNQSFPAVAARHELDSVVHETWIRLAQAMESVEPESAEHFFRLAAQKVRQVLLDLIERARRVQNHEVLLSGGESDTGQPAGGRTYDPERLTAWTEFHQRVATLPAEEREVFELHYYLDMPQADIADLLTIHPRKVSRLWVVATEKLADAARQVT
jgi:RNA polymerase sigma factor (sigma-70 family)